MRFFIIDINNLINSSSVVEIRNKKFSPNLLLLSYLSNTMFSFWLKNLVNLIYSSKTLLIIPKGKILKIDA